MLQLLSELLKAISEFANQDRNEFVKVIEEAQNNRYATEYKQKISRLATVRNRLSELETLLCRIYEDNALGKLPDARYAVLDAQYGKEQEKLSEEATAIEKSLEAFSKDHKSPERFLSLIDKYTNFDNLTIGMLNEFIDKILVHERDRKGSRDTTQEIEVYFNFVGKFVPPKFGEIDLTPEELEEQRKREERRDKLHQNYLKRKATGKAQAYNRKVMPKYQAEIAERKAAIRAEDIEKGVFIPVNSLPKLEPRKGV